MCFTISLKLLGQASQVILRNRADLDPHDSSIGRDIVHTRGAHLNKRDFHLRLPAIRAAQRQVPPYYFLDTTASEKQFLS